MQKSIGTQRLIIAEEQVWILYIQRRKMFRLHVVFKIKNVIDFSFMLNLFIINAFASQ